MRFADFLYNSITDRNSILCAGFDLRFDQIPKYFYSTSGSLDSRIEQTVTNYFLTALEAIEGEVACIKPNIAFFEENGFGALAALKTITQEAKKRKLPIILDAKRGDIGSTNEAYAKAYLSSPKVFGEVLDTIHADALTINPFLGLDSLEPFIKLAVENDKGLFFLVRTSNPDSALFQNAKTETGKTSTEELAAWVNQQSERLLGECRLSGVGAVIGATRQDEAKKLRSLMPNSYFLVPGFGAQGGGAEDAVAGMSGKHGDTLAGAIVNSSRGLFREANEKSGDRDEFKELIVKAVREANSLLNDAIKI